MYTLAKATTLLAVMLTAAPAYARDEGRPLFSGTVTGGSLGVGPEIGVRFSRTIGLRVNASAISLNPRFSSDGISYKGQLRLKSAGVMADLFPFRNGFRISAGARVNGNSARVRATPAEDTEIGSKTYAPQEIGTLTGRADTRDFAPVLTVGYAGEMQPGFIIGIEAGALFQGKVRISDFAATGLLAKSESFMTELAKQRDDLQGEVGDYKVYPILQLTMGYRF